MSRGRCGDHYIAIWPDVRHRGSLGIAESGTGNGERIRRCGQGSHGCLPAAPAAEEIPENDGYEEEYHSPNTATNRSCGAVRSRRAKEEYTINVMLH